MSLNGVTKTTGVSRRDFLRAGGLGAVGVGLGGLPASASENDDRAVILLFLVGGPSQLDTFDPKPDAPAEIRGPFRSIATSVPGIRLGEHLPKLARRMHKVALVRSVHHDAAPIHETGQQLLQTGRLCRSDLDAPHFGSVVASSTGRSGRVPVFAMVPGPIANTGIAVPHGQTAGRLGSAFEPASVEPDSDAILDAYGSGRFGRACRTACRLVESGSKTVVVNMYDTVFNAPSWDCHATRGFATLDDYARNVVPTFDRAYSALIDDLARSGRLDSTLVVATGEFGRTPRLNAEGGRDHWTGVWSALLAGGGIRGGQVFGASDRIGSEPADRPVRPENLLATIYRSLGISPDAPFDLGTAGTLERLVHAEPLHDLFG